MRSLRRLWPLSEQKQEVRLGNKKTLTPKRVIGDVLVVPIESDRHTYARVLDDASYAFYDCLTNNDKDIAAILSSRVLFFASVMDSAVKEKRWRIIGNVPLDGSLIAPARFIQDPLNKESFSLYKRGKVTPASRELCQGLERASVWYPEQIEERLRDHYAGRANRIVEIQKIR